MAAQHALVEAADGETADPPRPDAPDPSPPGPLDDTDLEVRIEFGRARMRVRDVLGLSGGSVVTLDRGAADPVDVYVNDRLVARGDLVAVEGGLGVRISQIIDADADANADANADDPGGEGPA